MNIRNFKKVIEYNVSALLEDCMLFLESDSSKQEKVELILDEAVVVYNEFKVKTQTPSDVKNKREYFRNLKVAFDEKLNTLYQKLSELIKEA